jgi:hypothetical protein
MGRIGIVRGQQVIEAMFRVTRYFVGEIKAEAAQSRRSDCDQKRSNGFSPFAQVFETRFD